MIEVLEKEYHDGELIWKGTISIVGGKVKFNIEDKELLDTVSSAPPRVIKRGAQYYLDYILGRFMFSSTIIMREVGEKPSR